jgi:hypothetical protein
MATAKAYLLDSDLAGRFSGARAKRLQAELAFALGRMERHDLAGWGGRSGRRLLVLTGRRVGGLARLAALLARSGGGELIGLVTAGRRRRFIAHLGDRTAAAIDGTLAVGREGGRLLVAVAKGLVTDPKRTAPAVIGAVLGFSAGSGGLDGNGGIPDLDLLAGIGTHRSPLTHTLIAGIVVEGLLLALADLAAEVHGRLPHDHDPLWDGLARIGRPLTQNLAIGTGAGLAYHLLVDAFMQPGALHGLPDDMPMEAHQGVMAASGLAEGAEAARKARRRKPADIVQGDAPDKSAGRRAVDAMGRASAQLGGRLRRRKKDEEA